MRRHGRPPGLGVVLAGENPASEVYVRNKIGTVAAAGCRADLFRVAGDATVADALAVVAELNADEAIDAILVQSPLPAGMGADAEQRVFDAIDPAKDIDGFHPYNVGLLVQKRPRLVACTPLGCIELLEREQIPLRGKHAVVIGRSDIVGKPMALLLLHRDATVTVCHSRTADLPMVARIGGRAGGRHWPRRVRDPRLRQAGRDRDRRRDQHPGDGGGSLPHVPGRQPQARAICRKGRVLAGDVHPEVEEVAGALTPVPGGVGPLTIAMVLRNTVTAAENRVS